MLDLKPGDRIELVAMPNDPMPVKPGTRGTVLGISELPRSGGVPKYHVNMEWDPEIDDNGVSWRRNIGMVVPPDRYAILARGEHESQ